MGAVCNREERAPIAVVIADAIRSHKLAARQDEFPLAASAPEIQGYATTPPVGAVCNREEPAPVAGIIADAIRSYKAVVGQDECPLGPFPG